MIDINKLKDSKLKLEEKIGDLKIDSIIITENGKTNEIIYNDINLHQLRSVSKLLVAIAVGIAIDKKMKINDEIISLETKIYPIIKEIIDIKTEKNLNKIKKWTIKTMLTHSSGYDKQMFSKEFINELKPEELLNYALNYKMLYTPNEKYVYNNVEPFIISVIFKEGMKVDLSEFIEKNVFKKLNINKYKWEKSGEYCLAATGLYMNYKDLHKIGSLILNNGVFNNEQIVSKEWINQMISKQIDSKEYYKPERVWPKEGAGYFTFISKNNYIFKDGSEGQYIIINKEKGRIITILSREKRMKYVTEIFREFI